MYEITANVSDFRKKIVNAGKTKLRNLRLSARPGMQQHAVSTSGDHDALPTVPTISSKVHTGDILMTWEIRWKKPILISRPGVFSLLAFVHSCV